MNSSLTANTFDGSFPVEKLRALMLLLQSDTENADVNEMITKAKKNYVRKHHKWAVSQMINASGYKKNKWKTYIFEDGKRKEILKKTENELYEWLFQYYDALDAIKEPLNPRALMTLMAKETGLRSGEQAALHKSDIKGDYIHVHRQQRKDKEDGRSQLFFEVPYTKEERMNPHDGRHVPITEECRKAIELALKLPGESEYLFHDKGKMVSKDSYLQNLKRRCRRLGIQTTNNHAFRMAFNLRMINLGFSSSDRALILGHEVQTNEAHYSLTDKRRLEQIRGLLTNEKEA